MSWLNLSTNGKPLLLTAAAVASTGVGFWILSSKRKKQQMEYEFVGRVSALNIFPIKSCAGLSEQEALITKDGIKIGDLTDRHFLLIRPNGDFITQRQVAMMSAIKPDIVDGFLVLSADKMSTSVKVPVKPRVDQSKIISCRVWNDKIDGLDLGDEASAWISEVLQEEGIRLVTVVPGRQKRKSRKPNAASTDKIQYQDDGPLLIATEASLADVISRVPDNPSEGEITMTNFRPNIVISGSQAWDEDNWSSLMIGESKLRLYTPCDRCLLTTVDPKKHDRRSDGEPLKTLKTFRMRPEISKSPMFGVFAGINVEGKIKVGDPVYALRK